MDDAAGRAVDGAFTIYVMQRGPIQSFASLVEFLSSAEQVTGLTASVLTPQYLVACADIWHESSDTPLQRDACRRLVNRLQELSSVVLISSEDVESIFHVLAHTSDYVPSVVLIRILECLVDPNDATAVQELECFAQEELGDDTLTCPMLMELCDAYLWLSHSLATNQQLICDAATALDDGILPDGPCSAEEMETMQALQNAIETGRQEHLSERLAARREAEAQLAPTGKPTASSVFYPQSIVATNGTGEAIESLLAPLRVRADTPTEALQLASELMAPQALVKRIGDLRRAEASQEAKRQQAARADILHTVYEATDLAPLGVERGSRQSYLRSVDVEGIGERAGKRLHPHMEAPMQSMLSRLSKELGVVVETTLPPGAQQRHKTSSGTHPSTISSSIHRKLTSLRQRDYEAKYLNCRRSRAVDKEKKAIQEAAGFFSPSQPRKMIPNFDTKMPQFFDVHPKTTKRTAKPCAQVTKVNVHDLRHELRIVLTDAVDALERSAQGH